MATRGAAVTAGAAIVGLLRGRPSPADAPAVWADWFAAKAELLDAVAAGSCWPEDAADAVELAERARASAAQYRALAAVEVAAGAGGPGPDGAA